MVPVETGSRAGDGSISVFFPCYNEESNVEESVRKAVEFLDGVSKDFEVIVVDDGSTDRTGELVDKLAEADSRVTAIHHSRNMGYGAALRSGFRAASKDLVFYTDGDGQFDIRELAGILPLIQDVDVVSCYRLHRQDGLIRRVNARCWTWLVCIVFQMRLRDIDCAFKLYRRQVLDGMPMVSTGALIDAEILARLSRKGCKILQRPVHHYARVHGKQTGARVSVILRAFGELLKLRKHIIN